MSAPRFTPLEFLRASEWITKHTQEKHLSPPPGMNPLFSIRRLDGNLIGTAIVSCETCDDIKVSNSNHFDITDYDAC